MGRSFLTVMLYLTGGFNGGATVFLPDDLQIGRQWTADDVLAEAIPEPGMCLVFVHSLMHAGAPVSRPDHESMPMKYIVRSELMYVRDGAVLGPDDGGWPQEGLRILRAARALEASGDFAGVIKGYNRLRYQ